MKNILIVVLLILPILTFGQKNNLSIGYGLIKTSYFNNGIDVGKSNFKNVLRQNTESYRIFKQGKLLMSTGNVIGVPGIIILLVTVQNQSNGNTPYAWQWIGGIGGSLVGTAMYYMGRGKTLQSVKVFNKSTELSFNFGRQNGIELTLNF